MKILKTDMELEKFLVVQKFKQASEERQAEECRLWYDLMKKKDE